MMADDEVSEVLERARRQVAAAVQVRQRRRSKGGGLRKRGGRERLGNGPLKGYGFFSCLVLVLLSVCG